MILKAKRPNAAPRVPSPSTSRTGNPSSAPVPRYAASVGGRNGTEYSLWNSASVVDQLAILVRPDWKKTRLIMMRMPRSSTGGRNSSAPTTALPATTAFNGRRPDEADVIPDGLDDDFISGSSIRDVWRQAVNEACRTGCRQGGVAGQPWAALAAGLSTPLLP